MDEAKSTLGSLAERLDARLLVVIAVLVPIAVAAFGVLYKRYNARKAATATQPAPVADAAAPPKGRAVIPSQLHKAWLRFLAKLPGDYRRSILNFEQFVVMGDAASGKSAVISAYTDWRRQAKQFVASQTDDKDLGVYLSSTAVISELPSTILHDHSDACRTALKRLWTPLYRRRSPTVVVVADARRIESDSPDAIDDLAETFRGKINLLASIRGRPLEVRVVLTHLDAIAGYKEFAGFCRDQGISMRIRLAGKDEPRSKLSGWLEGAEEHLPRALTTLGAVEYRRVVSFLRSARALVEPTHRFLTSLFAHEALAPDPIRGGVYLASEPAGAPNPLAHAAEGGPGPDPRIPHLSAAALVAAGAMTFLGLSYVHQRSLWRRADDALQQYNPAAANRDRERAFREEIIAFTQEHASWLDTHPDYFAGRREEMRLEFSQTIRDDLLIRHLRQVALSGAVAEGQLPMPHQRSLYYLALIHSDKRDELEILSQEDDLGRDRTQIWGSVTGIEPDLIVDYLKNTDVALREPVALELGDTPPDPLDTAQPWQSFLTKLTDAMADHVVRPPELKALQKEAETLLGQIDRLKNADITLRILESIDQYGTRGEPTTGDADSGDDGLAGALRRKGLTHVYGASFGAFLRGYKAFRKLSVEELAPVLETVRDAALTVDAEHGRLKELVDRLRAMYGRAQTSADDGHLIVIDGSAMTFDALSWENLIRESKICLLIEGFVRSDPGRSLFFTGTSADLAAVAWNPPGGAEAIFTGRSVLAGRYTRDAYGSLVRRTVLDLRDVLERSKIASEDQLLLTEFVRSHVDRYAKEYRRQVLQFIDGFELNAPSAEALRVALQQMSQDGATFDEFLKIVDWNTSLEVVNPASHAEEPMLAPMADVTQEFARWHEAVSGGAGTPRITQYKAIVAQMLADLLKAGDSAEKEADSKQAGGAAEDAKGGSTLEQELSPSGKMVLASLRSDKGAYAALLRDWVAGALLPSDQQGPFLALLRPLKKIGGDDIQNVVWRAYQRDFLPDVQRVARRFPFDRTAAEEVTPEELADLFHPKEGRVFDLFRRYLEPLSDFEEGRPIRQSKATQAELRLPRDMYRLVNAVAALSTRLWDDKGKPRQLVYDLETVPLGKGPNERLALTLTKLDVGGESLINFNQQPTSKTIAVDWTKPSSAQIAAQLTDADTKEHSFPGPIAVEGSTWSFLRLLRKARQPPANVKGAPPATLYTWEFPVERGSRVSAQVIVKQDPWEPFALGQAVSTEAAR